jgi:CRP/FNR family transcriptional regulator, nitrogen oxide reductase regulator
VADDTSPVLAGIAERDRAAILAAARPHMLRTRDVLAREGEPATTFHVVQLGHLKLTRLSPDGREIVVRFVGPGAPFAAIVATGQATYPVSATAIEPTRTLGWTREVLSRLLTDVPQLRANLLRQITEHMTEALTRVQELSTERVEQRLARALLRLAEHGGSRTADGIAIAHPITRQELADLVSTTLFTVSRTLARWQDEGLVASSHSRITVVRPRELAALATGQSSTPEP